MSHTTLTAVRRLGQVDHLARAAVFLLIGAAFGLICFGGYCVAEAHYRRLRAPAPRA
jgi:hypothetical protein